MERDSVMMTNVSYLKARDPSILSYNRAPRCLDICKTNLNDEFGEVTAVTKPEEKKTDYIRVYLRIKNGYNFDGLYQIDGTTLTSIVPPGSNFLRNVREGGSLKKTYNFTKIFNQETSQRDLFNDVVKPKILEFINGQNSTLLTYGASGSGKTFTVIGTDKEPGVVPRSLEYLFRTLPQLSHAPIAKPLPAGDVTLLNEQDGKKEKSLCRSLLNASATSLDKAHHYKTYLAMQQRLSTEPVAELDNYSDVSISVWVSFAEIYNEHIYDLLQVDPPRGHQRPKLRLGMSNNQPYIKNLTHLNVMSGQEAYQILQHGIHNLNYASTQLNKHSSRSHSIFTIKLVQVSKTDGGCCVSCFNFCDLAGSERSKKTHNVGDRLKESNNINSSLLVLGRCISAVRDLQKQNDHKLVPFRESKLTQLFQKALIGDEDIAMIVTISPSKEMFDESQHVLNFSAIAKDIIIEQKPETKKKSRFSELVNSNITSDVCTPHTEQEYQDLIFSLQQELDVQRNEYETTHRVNLEYVTQEYQKMLDNMEEQTRLKIESAERIMRLKYDHKIANMKARYEEIISQMKKTDVIEIDSSDDEGSSNKKPKLESSRDMLAATLCDGVEEYKQLQRKYRELERQLFTLQEKYADLQHELDYYRNRVKDSMEERGTDSEEPDYEEHTI